MAFDFAILRFVLFGNDIRILALPKGFDPLVRISLGVLKNILHSHNTIFST